MKPFLPILAVAISLTASLPSLAQDSAGSPPPAGSTTMSAPIPAHILTPPSGSKNGQLTVDKARYSIGQPIRMTFIVTNPTKNIVGYNFPTGQQFDITATDAKGIDVWKWSQGRKFSRLLTSFHIDPNGKKVMTAAWNGRDIQGRPLPPGTYMLKATLTSNNPPAVTGGIIVNTSTDPNNMGLQQRSPVETGAVRQVDVTPQVTANATIIIGGASSASR